MGSKNEIAFVKSLFWAIFFCDLIVKSLDEKARGVNAWKFLIFLS